MIEWFNFAILIVSVLFCTIYYIKSVQPAALEKMIGKIAYKKCTKYRIVSSIFMFVIIINHFIYFYYPLPINLPRYFPWDYWISVIIAITILIPSILLMLKGVHDAGKETIRPTKEQALHEGIYEKIRHPQAIGELGTWWIVPLLLNSPFLSLFSLAMIPIFYLFCVFEEKDLEIRYGRAYIEYRKRTGMFIPKLKGFKKNS